MKRIWIFLNRPTSRVLEDLPDKIYAVVSLVGIGLFHAGVVYCLITGKMIGRFVTVVEGRNSAPILYWIYMSFMILGLLVLDGFILRSIISYRRNEKKDA
jgi:hypothetical protein